MKIKIIAGILVVGFVAAFILGQYSGSSAYDGPVIQDGTVVPGSSDQLVSLNQGWSQAMQAGYWYGGNGSLIIPYDYFLVLEQANSAELFRSDANIERLRYAPAPKSQWNPDGVPVGFSKNYDPIGKGEWMALSCAGCHSTKISYQGTSMVINGAATMADFQKMMKELEEAMVATLEDEEKFDRFAKNILGAVDHNENRVALRADLKEKTQMQIGFNHRNRTPSEYGYGRVDAFAYAYNNIGVNFLGIPENHVPGIAPANYNFIWGTAQSDVLQWNGRAPNSPSFLPVFRVLGDVWGGGGVAHLRSGGWLPGYESTANIKGLGDMLAWVKVLQAPKWPEFILPKINQSKAAKGRVLYEQHCVKCHQLTLTREEQMEPYNAVMVLQSEVGTDRAELVLVEESVQKTGILEGSRSGYLFGETFGPTTQAKNLLNITSLGVMARQPIDTFLQGLRASVGVDATPDSGLYKYKARPLTGIWATAPYLHNGSVPSLYQLLLPSVERDTVFYTGNREFDPKHVGQVSDERDDLFRFDTRLYGNYNTGHEYGATLNDSQRFELIEFMKTL